MENLLHIWWLLREVMGFMLYFWPVSLLALLPAAFVLGGAWRRSMFLRHALRLVGIAAIVVAVLLVMSIALGRESAKTFPPPTAPAGYVVFGLWLVHVVLAIIVNVRAENDRLRLVPVTLATLWTSLAVVLVAFLSVSGAASL